jgi:hypothetical protein
MSAFGAKADMRHGPEDQSYSLGFQKNSAVKGAGLSSLNVRAPEEKELRNQCEFGAG